MGHQGARRRHYSAPQFKGANELPSRWKGQNLNPGPLALYPCSFIYLNCLPPPAKKTQEVMNSVKIQKVSLAIVGK